MGRLNSIPAFVRGLVVRQVEEAALAEGLAEVAPELMIKNPRRDRQPRGDGPTFVREMVAGDMDTHRERTKSQEAE